MRPPGGINLGALLREGHDRVLDLLPLRDFFVEGHAQHARRAALRVLDAHVERYRENRAVLLEGLPRAGFDALSSAGGAYYIYADVSRLRVSPRCRTYGLFIVCSRVTLSVVFF